MRVNILAAVAALAITLSGAAMAQDAPSPGTSPQEGTRSGRGAGAAAFHGVGGQITAIDGSTVTLQTFSGGIAKVKVTSSTRIMKDRNEAKLSDFKVGDRVFASGEQDKDGTWTAQRFGQRGGGFARGGMMGGIQAKPEDNGKTFIVGELIKVDGTKLTVKKPDNIEQVIEVDEETSFRNERRESVTLADLKVGDFLRGQGALKDGVFVPKELNAGRQRGLRSGTLPAASQGGAPQNQNQAARDSSEDNK
jgi:Cu/Ag efflux protein CusF